MYVRGVLVLSLGELGRFAEATPHCAEVIRLAESAHHDYTVVFAYRAASYLHLMAGDWAEARSLIERWKAVARAVDGALELPLTIACSAWVLAQLGETTAALSQLRESEEVLDAQVAPSVLLNALFAYNALTRAYLLLGRLHEAQRVGKRAVELSSTHRGLAAHALQLLGDIAAHPDHFDVEHGEAHYRRRSRSPRSSACARLLPIATSALASSTGGRASPSRRRSTSPPRRGCTARWTCGSTWSRRTQ